MFLVASIRECWIIAVKNKDYLKKTDFSVHSSKSILNSAQTKSIDYIVRINITRKPIQ